MRYVGLAVFVCVTAVPAASGQSAQPAFLGIVAQELAAAVPSASDRAGVRLEGSVTHLDLSRVGQTAIARCEVSLLVLEMPGGSLRAILRGQAEIRGPAGDRLEERAVRSAVRRAIRPLRGRLPLAAR